MPILRDHSISHLCPMDDRGDSEDEHGHAMKRADGQCYTAALFDAHQKESCEGCEEDDGQDKFREGKPGFSANILKSSYSQHEEQNY